MKKNLVFSVLLFFALSPLCYAQIIFGVNAGTGLADGIVGTTLSGYAGYTVSPKFSPYFEFQYIHGGVENIVINDGAESSLTGLSGDLMIPKIGCKYWLNPRNSISPYVNVSFMMPFATLAEDDENGPVNGEIQSLSDNLSMWGASAGFGVEYFLDANFSIGAEYGVRSLFATSQSLEVAQDGQTSSNSGDDYSLEFIPTYGKLSVNFYF